MHPAIQISDCSSDATYDAEQEIADSPKLRLEHFVEVSRDNTVSLALFLCHQLEQLLGFTATNAAEYASVMLRKSERTIRQWRSDFLEAGEICESKQGCYQRTGILWSSEDLNQKASKYVREISCVKGQPNLTVSSFCLWVNEDLPNSFLEPGFPCNISVKTARKWLNHLGFEVLSASKGMYFDGHEREDVVKERCTFLRRLVEIGFLHPDQAPTPEAAIAFPSDVPPKPVNSVFLS